MPSLGADMDEGTLLEWLVHPGDVVRRGDIVAVVDTAKAAVEVECFDSGVVERLLVEPGTRVPVGSPLATIASEAAPAPMRPPAVPASAAPPPATPPRGGPPAPFPPLRHLARQTHVDLAAINGTGPGGRVTHADVERAAIPRRRASPLARRIAAELGVDLRTVAGTGPRGAIAAEDVRHAAAARIAQPTATRPAALPDRTVAMRAAIAALMARSKREIPHYYLSETIDLGRAIYRLTDRNRQLPVPHRLQPRRPGRRINLWSDLPAAGRPDRLRQDHRPAGRRRRTHRSTPDSHRDPRRGPRASDGATGARYLHTIAQLLQTPEEL